MTKGVVSKGKGETTNNPQADTPALISGGQAKKNVEVYERDRDSWRGGERGRGTLSKSERWNQDRASQRR